MNLIHGALFVVLTFMGTISLSAQTNWLPPAEAATVISNELAQLALPPAPPASQGGLVPKQIIADQTSKIGCPDCLLKNVKYQFLTLVMQKLKEGEATGVAVGEVRAQMISLSNNNATMLATIQTAYEFMINRLS